MTYKRIDDNQKSIVTNLRRCGFTVTSLASIGKGCPDIIVGAYGINLLFEIKDGSKTPSQQKLTPMEMEFRDSWKGQYNVVTNFDEAITVIDMARKTFKLNK